MGVCCSTNVNVKPSIQRTDQPLTPNSEIESVIQSFSVCLHAKVEAKGRSSSKILELKLDTNPLLSRRKAARSISTETSA
jgi:hypothetical protein